MIRRLPARTSRRGLVCAVTSPSRYWATTAGYTVYWSDSTGRRSRSPHPRSLCCAALPTPSEPSWTTPNAVSKAIPNAVLRTPKRPRPTREQRTAHRHRHRRNRPLRRGRAGPRRAHQVTGHPQPRRRHLQHLPATSRCACAGRRPDGSWKVRAATCGRSATCCPRWCSPIYSPRTSPRPAGPDGPIMI